MSEIRSSKYTDAVLTFLASVGHATNAQILSNLRVTYPELSATTIHRITTRLHERGELGIAPPAADGSVVYDANKAAHDHFFCDYCKDLRDISLPKDCLTNLEVSLGDCRITGSLMIHGSCGRCIKKEAKSK